MKILARATVIGAAGICAISALSACTATTASGGGLDGVNCTSVLPEVKALEGEGSLQLLEIYKPSVVKDKIAEFKSGSLKVPADKSMVEVLTCKGVATFSDTTEAPITYGVQVDEKDQIFIRWNA